MNACCADDRVRRSEIRRPGKTSEDAVEIRARCARELGDAASKRGPPPGLAGYCVRQRGRRPTKPANLQDQPDDEHTHPAAIFASAGSSAEANSGAPAGRRVDVSVRSFKDGRALGPRQTL